MLNETRIDTFIKQVLDNLPTELTQIKSDLEKTLKSAMSSSFAKMDLVTREEFDVQSELLSRTRALLDEMEQKVLQLEATIARQKQEK